MGRLPAFPDIRDYTPKVAQKKLIQETQDKDTKDKIEEAFERTLNTDPRGATDNSGWLPPVRNQGNLGSCVAFSWICALEYLHKMLYRRNIEFSQLYTYKMGRDLAFGTGAQGDTGLWLKNGVGSLVRHGAVESKRYPYDISIYDEYPPAHLHGYADDFRAVKYFRLDGPTIPRDQHLTLINQYITERWPVVTGFYCFDSLNLSTTSQTGEIPFPRNGEAVIGGHAIYLYGFDENKKITNPTNGQTTTGAWKIRNSWGTGWGQSGNGWLPFAYLTDMRYGQPLADEFYSITSSTWLNVQDFE